MLLFQCFSAKTSNSFTDFNRPCIPDTCSAKREIQRETDTRGWRTRVRNNVSRSEHSRALTIVTRKPNETGNIREYRSFDFCARVERILSTAAPPHISFDCPATACSLHARVFAFSNQSDSCSHVLVEMNVFMGACGYIFYLHIHILFNDTKYRWKIFVRTITIFGHSYVLRFHHYLLFYELIIIWFRSFEQLKILTESPDKASEFVASSYSIAEVQETSYCLFLGIFLILARTLARDEFN